MTIHPFAQIQTQAAVTDIEIRSDLTRLRGRVFRPKGLPKAAIILHGATAVPQRFYQEFARWLTTLGYGVLTYDYRDFGESLRGDLRDSRATMAQWGVIDQSAAQSELERQFPGTPIWAIGHSLGGLMMPFQPNAARFERIITLGSGPVHLRDHPWPYRALAAAFWFGPAAWLVPVLGKFPGRLLGFGPDLPRGVFRQWRRWCTSNGFFTGDIHRELPPPDLSHITARMKFVAVSDDPQVPPKAVWKGMQYFTEAHKKQLTLKPENFGLEGIGHIRAFAAENAATWPEIIAD